MRKLIYSLTALLALASCAKEQQEPVPTPPNGGFVTVSFVAEPNSTQTRAFFGHDRKLGKIPLVAYGILLQHGRQPDRKA